MDLPAGRVFAVVLGRPGADRLYAALDEGSVRVIEAPRLCGPGWWLLEADVTVSGADRVERVMSDGGTGLVIQGDSAPYGIVSVFEPGRPTGQFAFGAPMISLSQDKSERSVVDGWLGAYSPKARSERALKKIWADLVGGKVREIAPVLLRRWGWTYTGVGPASLLQGCAHINDSLQRPVVGLTRVDWAQVRWVVGAYEASSGQQVPAMWDLDAPGLPVRRWQPGEEGRPWARAQFALVGDPILAATVLNGTRLWIPIRRTPHADLMPGVLMHFSLDQTLAVIYPTENPRTLLLGHPGRSGFIPEVWAARAGLEHNPNDRNTELHTVEDAQRLAYGVLARHYLDEAWEDGPSPWRPVPDDVPRGLLDTTAWLRANPGS